MRIGAYKVWLAGLGVVMAAGFCSYLRQLDSGLGITGLSRDVTWGLYIAQFTFLVGVAASAVMVVLPYYLHDCKSFARITVLGEFLAIAAVVMCMLFILVDLGQPTRVLNVLLYPSPRSVMFWDVLVLSGYLVLNILIAFVSLRAEREEVRTPGWLRPVILLSIPWAVGIHTVTAFLYNGLAARPLWLTALMAPRFLASAFASGPALLILLCMIMARTTKKPAPRAALDKLAVIVTYAMAITVFFLLMEIFTAFYSQVPGSTASWTYMLGGLEGHRGLAPWIWCSMLLAAASLVVLLVPRYRHRPELLAAGCGMVFLSVWLDKGIGLIVPAFVPSPLGQITDYAPSLPEILISLGIWAVGALIVTVLFRKTLDSR